MKIAAHFLVRDEEDVIKEVLDHASTFCDQIYLLDTGSSDSTYEIALAHPKMTWCMRKKSVYSDALRQLLVERSRNELSDDDWFLALSADHFFTSDPRTDLAKAAAERADVITYDVAQFYFTAADLKSASAGITWRKTPLEERIRHYAINYHDFPVAFRNQPGISYAREVTEWPTMPERKIASFHPVLKHYQFRSPEQMQRRLKLRRAQRKSGFSGFRHYGSFSWKRYVFDPGLLHFFKGDWEFSRQPSLDTLLKSTEPAYSRAWVRLKEFIKATRLGWLMLKLFK